MAFSRIKDFLDIYKTNIVKEDERRKVISRVILNTLGLIILEADIVIKKGEVEIKGDSVLKNELFLQKEKIIKALHDEGENINFIK